MSAGSNLGVIHPIVLEMFHSLVGSGNRDKKIIAREPRLKTFMGICISVWPKVVD